MEIFRSTVLLLGVLGAACSPSGNLSMETIPSPSAGENTVSQPEPAGSGGNEYLQVLAAMQTGASPPSFLADGERFWFVAGPADSAYITLVDPVADAAEPLLDVQRTRRALSALDVELPGRGLPFEEFGWLDESEERIVLTVAARRYVLDRATYTAFPAPDSLVAALERREPRALRGGLFLHSPPIREVPAPDGRWMVTVRDGDLWLRSTSSPDSVRLTREGVPEHGWDLEGARWSPDSRYLAAFRIDRRGVPKIPLVSWTQPGTPIEQHPFSMVGEPIPRPELYIVDTRDHTRVRAGLGNGGEPYIHVADWHPRGREVYVLRMNRLMNRLDLVAVDASSGRSRVLISEESETFLWGIPFLHGYTEELREMNLAVPLAGGERLLWTSERDGGRRIYLYRTGGDLVRALTPDTLLVRRLELVDDGGGWAYFTASDPRSPHPYALALYRVPISGGSSVKVVDLPEAGGAWLTRSGRFLVLSRAGLEQPPTLELRRSDGLLLRTLWTADTSLLDSLGWKAPERFTATAADGETDLYGRIFRPTRFDPAGRYPVIEHIYAGPQTIHTPRAMWDYYLWINQWLAEQGFVVVTVDGRGTPGRAKAFQDVVHGRIGQFEISDHAAALQQAAASRPYMDLGRVGIFGHSLGGYFTVRALLTRPELYKVGVASAPVIDLSRMRVWAEAYMGCLPESCPEAYAAGDNTPLAARLNGKLLLVHGTHDTHIPFGEPMRMAEALILAGKRFDLLVLPEENHVSLFGPYWMRMVGDYFVEHLRFMRGDQP